MQTSPPSDGEPIRAGEAVEGVTDSRTQGWLQNAAGLRELATLLIVIVVILVFHARTLPSKPGDPFPSAFLSRDNIEVMLRGMSFKAIMAVGMCIVIVGGGFDISVGSVMALSGLVAAQALILGAPVWMGVLAGVQCGALCGAINGLLISRARVSPLMGLALAATTMTQALILGASPWLALIASVVCVAFCGLLNWWLTPREAVSPLIATLGMMMVARGLVLVHIHEHGAARSDDLPKAFLGLGQAKVLDVEGLWVIAVTLAVVLTGDVLLRNLRWLRQVYYIGGNEKAAGLSGINVPQVRTVTFIVCGMTAAIAGVLNSAHFGTASYEAGTGLELQVIAACVIGGASLVGGQGTILGAFLGVVLVTCITTGLTQIKVPTEWQNVLVGAALVFFVTIDVILARRRQG